MKRKYAALLLGLTLNITMVCSPLTAFAEEAAGESSAEVSAEEDGEEAGLTEEDSRGTNSGTEDAPENEANEGSEDSIQGEIQKMEGSVITIITDSGEEQDITVTDDTIIVRQGMGGQPGEMEDGGTPPEKPEDAGDSGEAQADGGAPEKPDSMSREEEEITLADLSEGDKIRVTLAEDGTAEKIVVMSEPEGMGQSGVDSYNAAVRYTEDAESDGETIASTGTDENAVLVENGANVTIGSAAISRDSADSTGGYNSSFYGVGSAVLVTDGTVSVKDSEITTDAKGGAGVFAYGDGTAYVADTTITTQQDTSGGIHAAGGGTLYAWDLDVTTSGESSAAIRSDRGGGKMTVDGGTYTSNGVGSPAIYSTADIAVNNASLTANGSEAICIEGLNSIRLYDCDLTGNMSDDSQNDCTWNVILYQSMSGDSEIGNSTFEMNGGTLTAQNGGMFYTTNTESTFILSDVDIQSAEDSEFFLRCTGNANQRGWGETGANGADCLFTAINQQMDGDVIWDSISSLDFYITDGSTLTGAVINDESYAGEGGSGYSNLYIDESSTWVVTGDSRVSGLYCAGSITDGEGNTVTIEGTDGTVYVQGDSQWTITTDSYEETADLSGASQTTAWADYQAEKPEALA